MTYHLFDTALTLLHEGFHRASERLGYWGDNEEAMAERFARFIIGWHTIWRPWSR